MTLSGTRSGTTLTDAQGNYTFLNLPLGGTYRVTPQNPFNLFDPPFVASPGLSDDAQADFGASANPSPMPTPPIRDDFTGATNDYRTMIFSFICPFEYQSRFGPVRWRGTVSSFQFSVFSRASRLDQSSPQSPARRPAFVEDCGLLSVFGRAVCLG